MVEQPSRQVLDGIAARVLTFLIGVGRYFPIRAALAARGYTAEQHDRAWDSLKQLAVFPAGTVVVLDKAVGAAVIEIDAWDEPNFAVIRTVLENHHPDVVDFVFENLSPKQGPEAVVGVATLLDRLDALESAPARKATRKADVAALETLAARGYTKEERARLRALVVTTQALVVEKPISDVERAATLLKLHGWYNEWSGIARLVLARRDHQIAVGIAKRRKAKKEAAPMDPVPPVVVLAPASPPVVVAPPAMTTAVAGK